MILSITAIISLNDLNQYDLCNGEVLFSLQYGLNSQISFRRTSSFKGLNQED
jgi:hypothetical protein